MKRIVVWLSFMTFLNLLGYGGDYSSLAFDLLMPVSTISNYVRLVSAKLYISLTFFEMVFTCLR